MDAHPTADEAVLRARAAVDPVLVPAGFLPGQGGGDDERGQRGSVLWCGAYDDLFRDRPGMTGGEQELGVGACVDVMVDLHRDAGPWLISGVRVEVRSLADLLWEAGDEAGAVRAEALDGAVLEPALPELADLLARLLSAT